MSVDDALADDTMFIGTVYRGLWIYHKPPRTLAREVGHMNSRSITTFVWAIRYLCGEVPESRLHPLPREYAASFLRRTIDTSLDMRLVEECWQLLSRLTGEEPPHQEPGVYVYSYPTYIGAGDAQRDMKMKIGASTSMLRRLETQRRHTEVPEDLVVLRIYSCPDPFDAESHIHAILTLCGKHVESLTGGTEWYETSLVTVDAICRAMGIEPSPNAT